MLKPLKTNRLALKIGSTYFIVSVAWILLSDELVKCVFANPDTRVTVSMSKGLLFVLATTFLLYRVLSRLFQKLAGDMELIQQAEAARAESEMRYRQLFEAQTDAVLLVDSENCQILDANPAAQRMYGFSRDELIQLKATDLSMEPDKTQTAVMMTETHIPLRTHRRKDGTELLVEINCSEFHFGARRIHVAAIRDITERKRVEAALKESEARYRQLFELESDALFLADGATHQILDVNHSTQRLYGYTREELLKMKLEDVSAESKLSRASIDSGENHIPLRWHRKKNGEQFPVEITTSEFEFQKRRLKLGAVRDIAERKKAEAKQRDHERLLRAVMDLVPHFIFVKDSQSRHLLVNAACAQANGLTPEQMVGLSDLDCLRDPAQAAAFMQDDREVIASGKPIRNVEERLTNAAGEVRILQTSKIPFLVPGGGAPAVMGVAVDITDLKKAEAALRESEAKFSRMFDSSPAATSLSTIGEGRYLDVNHAWLKLFQRRREEVVGHTVFELNIWADLAQRAELFSKLAEQGEVHHFEMNLRTKTGQPLFVLWSGVKMEIAGELCLLGSALDITQWKQAEVARRKLEGQFNFALEASRIGAWEIDLSNQTSRRTLIHGQIFGYEPPLPDWSYDVFLQHVVPEDRAEVARITREALAANKNWNLECRIQRRDGAVRWIFVAGGHEIQEAGEAGRISGIVQDITERKHAEEAARQQAGLVMSLLDCIPDLIFFKDLNGVYLGCNPSFVRFVGRPKELIIGKTDHDFFSPEVAEFFRDHDRKMLDRLESKRNEEWVKYPNGDQVLLDTLKTPYWGPDGKLIGVLGISRDITGRRQAEENLARLVTAVEQAAEAIVITDVGGTMLYVNPAFEKISGYTRAEAVGKNPRILKSGRQDQAFYREMWDVLKRGEIWSGHFVNKRKDAAIFEEEVTISPIRNDAGKVINYVAVKRDVTREVQLEAQFRQAQKMEAIGTLAGGIAHDFNNILAAMFGYGYLLQQDTEGNASAQESVREILGAANRAKELVQQILTFSRQRERKREVVRLETVVKEVAKFLRASLPANIRIELLISPHTPAVLADPTQIYQVTMNLATNALHALEGRQGQLTITLESFTPEASFLKANPQIQPVPYARLSVADTGHGMDAQTVERIFEPFFTTKPVGKGTGLGLSVVHGIVQAHEGVITVESQVGQGTTFRIYFPAKNQDADLAVTVPPDIARGKGQRVLLVDDEPALTAMFQQLLTRLNYQVTATNSPPAAVRLFQENPDAFDVVMTDMTMPEMTGLEVARQIIEVRPQAKIILASGYLTTLTNENLQKAGICELIHKPVSLLILASALQRALTVTPGLPI